MTSLMVKKPHDLGKVMILLYLWPINAYFWLDRILPVPALARGARDADISHVFQ